MAVSAPLPESLPERALMRPRLRDDVAFISFPGGAFVSMPFRPDLGFNLPGRTTYDWLRRLRPFLTGDHTLADLGRRLDDARRARVFSLVERLREEGAVQDAAGDRPHTLPGEVRRAHAQLIALIARSADSPERRFEDYRNAHPIVIGSGRLLAPLIHGLLATGVERVRATVTPESPTDLDRALRLLTATFGPAADDRVQIDVQPEASLPALSGPPPAGLLHVSERPMPMRARALAALCERRGLAFGQAILVGDHGLVGPVGDPRLFPPRWYEAVEPGAASAHVEGPPAAIVANHLCAAFFRHVIGLPTESARQVIDVDLETLVASARPAGEVRP